MINQMLVQDFISLYVKSNLRKKFLRIMIEWDGRRDVVNSFYDLDVLNIKLKESGECHYV